MLRIDSKNMNFNGTSLIDGVSLVSLNANINEPDNNGYVSINISNIAKLRENIETGKIDINAFIDEILAQPVSTIESEEIEETEE